MKDSQTREETSTNAENRVTDSQEEGDLWALIRSQMFIETPFPKNLLSSGGAASF